MPYKNKVLQREAVKKAVQKHRVLQGEAEAPDNVIPEHPVMKYLIPGENRKKMEAIVESLKKHNQLHNVYLGAGKHLLPLDIVGELLEVTQ